MSAAFVIKGLIREEDSRTACRTSSFGLMTRTSSTMDLMGDTRTGCGGSSAS